LDEQERIFERDLKGLAEDVVIGGWILVPAIKEQAALEMRT
jgi:hypothetical protein